MSSVDSRIVTMKFDNAAFRSGVSTTLSALDKLKQSLQFKGGSKGMEELQTAANRFSLGPMEGAVTGVSKKFLALSTVAITALANITNKAVNAGINIVKSLSLEPVMAGFHEYETQMNAIQTILANTKDKGSGLEDVNKALNELNTYADKTIYNFTEMTRNIGTFTAAGVDLNTSVSSIKGIANLAAISGSTAEQASTAMYQLSQALASGKVQLMDWNSVVNAGMGGAVFQKALLRTAENLGTIKKGAVETVGPMKQLKINGESFRDSLSAKGGEEPWLTSEVLTNTLKQLSGDMSEAELKAQGFSAEQVKAIKEMGDMGVEAATKVKTLSQLMDTLKEAVGSGWTQSFQLIFGDFEESRTMFTNVSNALGQMISNSANARNKVLSDWKNLGGRDALMQSFVNAFHAVLAVVKPIKDAFHDLFPPMTGKLLAALTKNLQSFTAALIIGSKTSENLRRTFRGFFAILKIGTEIIHGVFRMFLDVFGALGDGSGSVLNFTGNVGDLLVKLEEFLVQGGYLYKFFDGIGRVIAAPIQALVAVAHYIGQIFSGFDGQKAQTLVRSIDGVTERFDPLAALGERVHQIFGGLFDLFSRLATVLTPVGKAIQKAASAVGKALVDAFSGDNFSTTLDTINTGLFAGFVLLVKKFISNGLELNVFKGSGGMFGAITESFKTLTGTLKAMQGQIKAKTLMMIAGAVGILTVSIVALSLIDSDKLTKAMGAIAVAFTQLLVAMQVLNKIGISGGYAKIPMIAGSMILLSTAVLILTAAVKNLSDLNWGDLAKGLIGVGALLAMISVAVIPISKSSSGMIRAGIGIAAMAVGIKILASAVADFAQMNWGDMGKGLAGVAGSLILIAGAMRIMPKNITLQAASLVILGGALEIIAHVVDTFGKMKLGEMGKGLLGIAGALVVIAGAMQLMPLSLPLTAAGLVLVGAALVEISVALQKMGGMSWSEIGKGLVTLAGALVILAGGLYLMSGTLAGSAALLVAAGALAVLTPVLIALGNMSWTSIAKGMATLAGAFAILGLAGLALAPLEPIIMGLSLALLAVGAGLALAGAGALAFATAFSIAAAVGTAGIAVLEAAIAVIVASIPAALKAFAEGVVAFVKVIGDAGPVFLKAFTTILTSLLDAVINVTPKIGQAFLTLLDTALNILVNAIPKLVTAGMQLLLGLLKGISDNIAKIVSVVGDIIVKFLNALAEQLPRIVDAGVNLIITFINGVAKAIDDHAPELGEAAGRLGVAIIKGIAKGIAGGVGEIIDAAKNAAKSALDSALHFLHIKSPSRVFRDQVGAQIAAGMALGINENTDQVAASAEYMARTSLDTVKKAMMKMTDLASSEINTSPVISPVLDLSNVQKNASALNKMVNPKVLAAQVSYGQAASISSDRQTAQATTAAAPVETVPPIVFEQNNYSPKALSAVEIYRQTKNQLSLAKEALK